MNDTFFDDLDAPVSQARDWSQCPTPPELRDYRLVLADACPWFDKTRQQYFWCSAGYDWEGVNPPIGMVPAALWQDMVFLMRFTHFETRQGAMAALEVVILRRERNLTGRDG